MIYFKSDGVFHWVNCVLNSHTLRCVSASPQTQHAEAEPSALSLLAAVTINNFAYKEIRGGIAAHLSAQLQNICGKEAVKADFFPSVRGAPK